MQSLLAFAASMSRVEPISLPESHPERPRARLLTCRDCGMVFSAPVRGRPRLRCDACRAPKTPEERSLSARQSARARWGPPRPPWKPPPGYISPSQRGTCSECGKAVAVSRSSAPPDRRRCRDCQRANLKYPPKPPWVPQVLTCRCGRDFEQSRYGQLYCCPEHRPDSTHVKVASNLRGYGAAHRQARKRALAAFAEGTPCPRCGEPMSAEDELHLDHADGDKGTYLGLAHAGCNLSWGAKRGNEMRRAV